MTVNSAPPTVALVRHGAGAPPPVAGPAVRLEALDVYQLPTADLSRYQGIFISAMCDQRAIAAQADRLSAWVRAGGRLLFNGHPLLPVVERCPSYRKMEFHGMPDVWLTARDPHPLWEGVDRRDVLLRTGVPGQHSFAEMQKIGVAGFYSRAYLVGLPEDATVITGIGEHELPVDVAYPLGDGEVIVHCGLDLLIFNYPKTTVAGWPRRIIDYLAGVRA